jgi:hypothetical protein
VKIKFFGREVILLVCFIFLFPGLTFAGEKDVVSLQGIVDELYLSKKMMIVNEHEAFIWDPNTIFYNEKGLPTTIDKLKIKTWVYIEGISDQKDKPTLIKKIYLSP